MANLGSGNSNVNIDGATSSFIDFGGTDTYTILSSLSGNVTITDNQASTINLPEGLTISDASFLSDGVQFTIGGNTVTLLGNPSLFTFVFGGTPLDPTAGTSQFFGETATAFGTTAPASGEPAKAATITGTVNGNGTVGTGTTPVETFALTANAPFADEGTAVTFTLTTQNVDAGTDVDYTITGVSAADITSPLTGTATVGADGTTSISVQISADQLTEGPEILTLSLDNGEATAGVTVLDTSVPASNTYLSGTGGNGVVSEYNIEIVFESAFSTAERAAFETAADYLSSLIIGDVPDQGPIDDIRITAMLEPIDDQFGTLAFAGPTEYRLDGSFLPTKGQMTFDTADIAWQVSNGSLTNTVVHEMMHALGFGTLWGHLDFITSGSNARFTGDNAIAAYNAEFPSIAGSDGFSDSGVPLDGGHWDEDLFNTEIMTPILNGSDDYMSGTTVASLEDMGYDTVFDVSVPAATMPQLDDFMFA